MNEDKPAIKLAIFDFDGTLFLKDTLPFLLKLWSRFNYSKIKLVSTAFPLGGLYLSYKLCLRGARTREEAVCAVMQRFTKIFDGMEKAKVEGFFDRCAKVVTAQLNSEVVEEVKKAKATGFHTVLLSGCYTYLLELIGRPLMIDTVIGTMLSFKDGRVDLRQPLDIVYGDKKASRIRSCFADEEIDWEASFAYADSYSDLSVLQLVGNPVAVNPDAKLMKLAEDMRWRIISSQNSDKRAMADPHSRAPKN